MQHLKYMILSYILRNVKLDFIEIELFTFHKIYFYDRGRLISFF